MDKPKAFNCICEDPYYTDIIFAKSEKSAGRRFKKLHTLDSDIEINIKRAEEFDYINRKNGDYLDSSNRDDRLIILKHGYECNCGGTSMDVCAYCFLCDECNSYKQDFRNESK